MRPRLLPLILALLLPPALGVLPPAAAQPAPEAPLFVGVKGCQTCHAVSHRDHYHDWLATKHARAFSALKGKERNDPACLRCHTTGHGGQWAPGVGADDLQGVQCEACHGPGSLYRPQAVMKDHKAARDAGLQVPTRETCLRCHQ